MNASIKVALERILEAKQNNSFYLDLSGLGLRDLPNEIGELTNLVELNLSFNSLYILPAYINQLKNLKHLNISSNLFNHINGIGFDFPCNLPLKYLDISNNNFSKIPEDLFNLDDIEELDVNLSNNPALAGIPTSIIEQGFIAVDAYFKELQISKYTDSLLEAKLLLVGQGEVGKTSLMKKLTNSSYIFREGAEITTHGINIKPWNFNISLTIEEAIYFHFISRYELDSIDDEEEEEENEEEENEEDDEEDTWSSRIIINDFPIKAKLNIWDFGGQEIYYSTHQFFLTKRSIYVFVWDARKEEEYRGFEYWFNTINVLSENSPVIIVMNKSDVRTKHIDQNTLKSKFPNIKAFHQTSCLTNDGIYELRRSIISIFRSLPHFGERLPKIWITIRNHLAVLEKNFIYYEEYLQICSRYDVYTNSRVVAGVIVSSLQLLERVNFVV